jgi:membrane-associated phospholipid phosphatase
MKEFVITIPRNTIGCFRGKNLIWHGIAIIATIVIVETEFDWTYFVATRPYAWGPLIMPAVSAGMLLPILLPLLLLAISKAYKLTRLAFTAWALWQAALIGWLISAFYKAFTGRIQPPHSTAIDTSHSFNFGFWQHGIFWGWPSSHTTVAFAMAFALITLYPKSRAVRYCSLLYALYIGLCVSVSIHWFSEFVAGAIIGSVVGIVVGKYFRQKMSASSPNYLK